MRALFRRFQADLLVLLGLGVLPSLFFWSVTFGGRTLLPADNLAAFEPWHSAFPAVDIPHNQLLSDLVLENYPWKKFILESLQSGELPLWNPYQFSGIPFLAAGQHSALYPFSIFFYVLPLPLAYGWFTVSQFFLAGVFTYLLLRVLGLGRVAATFGALIYEFSLFMVVSVVFTMIIAGAAWLPLILALIELAIRQHPALGERPATLPWVVLGAGALGMQILAGHVEITYYTLLIAGAYSAWRLFTLYRWEQHLPLAHLSKRAMALLGLAGFGMALGAVQLVPLYEIVSNNFRSGSATFEQIISWAYPWRHVLVYLIPNFYGNPSHHTYLDLFTWQNTLAPLNNHTIDWGIKNYVEGGTYLGLLPLFLLPLAALAWWRVVRDPDYPAPASLRLTAPFFFALAFFALAFAFPTRLYALIFWLPGINQLHSPFRWVWPLTLSVAVLSAYGIDYLQRSRVNLTGGRGQASSKISVPSRPPVRFFESSFLRPFFLLAAPSAITFLAGLAFWGGCALVLAIIVARVGYEPLSVGVLMDWLVKDLALADRAFTDGRMFFSYEARWAFIAGLMLIASGVVLRVSRCPIYLRGRPIWEYLALGVIVLDLFVAGSGFNPAADPALLSYTPPSVEFLRQDTGLWRFTTYDTRGAKPFNANVGWYFNLQDVRGYDSIFTKQYKNYMELIEPQYELDYNRIAPLSHVESLDSPLLDLLNVKYVISVEPINNSKYTLVYSAEVQIYQNATVMPRAYLAPRWATLTSPDFGQTVQTRDPRQWVIIEDWKELSPHLPPNLGQWPTPIPDSDILYTSNEVMLNATANEDAWLVLADSYFPGWKAFVRPLGANEAQEREVPITRVNGNFRGVELAPGAWTVRFKYSPLAPKLGGITSLTAGMTLLFMLGIFTWRYFYQESAVDSTARRVAKNSLAPMVLNLFNRAIDLGFAAFMLRVLGPEDAGSYYFAIVVFGWFEIITNYGLNTLLTRDVSRDREHANRYLINTTVLRLVLGVVAIPALALFLTARQTVAWGAFQPEPLPTSTLTAIMLLVIAQFPASFSTGLAALFYAYEKAEYPAAVATVSTLLKVSLGTVVLVLGTGFVGLAGVSIAVNVATLGILGALVWRMFFRPRWELDWSFQRHALTEAFPLMLNNLLATLFFKVDVTLLEPLRGPREVGWYSTGYKFLDAYNIVPSLFTFALFPVMSRQAQATAGKTALQRSYVLAIKLLVAVALPLSVLTTFLAPTMIGLLGGAAYLPDGAIALALMVWSMPFGWINSVTNYVLIALEQQRGLTRAFAVALVFNVVFNLLLIPRYGYAAAAVVTIASEIFEGMAFYWYVRRSLGPIAWVSILWRPWVCALGMAGVMFGLWVIHPLIALVVGPVVYVVSLTGMKTFTPEEQGILWQILPERMRH